MKRSGFKPRTKPMRKRSAKRQAYRASDEGQAAIVYMGSVKKCPCCVCGHPAPSEAHHCRSDFMPRNDFATIPLCYECHRGQQGFHAQKSTWENINGPDHGFIKPTMKLVNTILERENNEETIIDHINGYINDDTSGASWWTGR